MLNPDRQLGGWSDDAKAAIVANPDYFVWWYTTKSLLLVAVSVALAYTLGKKRRRTYGGFRKRTR